MWLVLRSCPILRLPHLSALHHRAAASALPWGKLVNGNTRLLEGEKKKCIYQLVGFPCVVGRPARSCPLAGPLDCMLLLGSLKDQEENLIVVKTWTWKREWGEKKREHTRQSAIVSAPAQTYCKTLCSCLTDAWLANTHTVSPYACKRTHSCACMLPVSL